MRSEGYGTWFVCVCVSVRSISATMSKSKPRKRYQRFIATKKLFSLFLFNFFHWFLVNCNYIFLHPNTCTCKLEDKTKRIKLGIFLKTLRSKVMASFAHFVGVRRSCRALQFILTATEAAIATQKPNGKLNTAC